MSSLNYLNKAILLLFIFVAVLYYTNIMINEGNKKLEKFGDAIVYDVIFNTSPYVARTPDPSILKKLLCSYTDNSDGLCLNLLEINN